MYGSGGRRLHAGRAKKGDAGSHGKARSQTRLGRHGEE
jgi:hypothetical protein